jgi:predicted nucleic acid-binding protein
MPGNIFIDTNLLVYSCDISNAAKQEIARHCLEELAENARGVLSTQVLQEFYVASTGKLRMRPFAAKELIRSFAHFRLITVSSEIIMDAIDCSTLFQLSFWDSLIIAAAESANCEELWSEDLNDGQVIRGVRIRNPFKQSSPHSR